MPPPHISSAAHHHQRITSLTLVNTLSHMHTKRIEYADVSPRKMACHHVRMYLRYECHAVPITIISVYRPAYTPATIASYFRSVIYV